MKYRKPPLGVTPKWIHDELRKTEIRQAVKERISRNYKIPMAWIEEWNELVEVQDDK